MAMRMPEVDGIKATVLIKSQEPRTQVVILSAFSEKDSKRAAEFMGSRSTGLPHICRVLTTPLIR